MKNEFNNLLDKISSNQKLSEIIPRALMLSKKLNNNNLEEWLKLELNGYFSSNPVMTHEIIVPEYRTVGGMYYNKDNQPLIIQDPKFSFINETRLRNGISELESFIEENRKYINFVDLNGIYLIKSNLNIEVHYFMVSKSSIVSVVNRIRTELMDRLVPIEFDLIEIKTPGIKVVTESVQRLVINGKLDEALNEIESSNYISKEIIGEITLQRARLKEFRKRERLGLFSNDEIQIQITKIGAAILELVEEFK